MLKINIESSFLSFKRLKGVVFYLLDMLLVKCCYARERCCPHVHSWLAGQFLKKIHIQTANNRANYAAFMCALLLIWIDMCAFTFVLCVNSKMHVQMVDDRSYIEFLPWTSQN